MRILTLAVVGGLVLSGTSPAFAQDEDEVVDDAAMTDDEGEGAAAGEGSGQAYAEVDQRFPIRRGFFAQGDFGVFFSIGGRDPNGGGQENPNAVPSKAVSNAQLALGLMLGYDLYSDETSNIAAGLKLGLMLNSGAARITDAEAQQLQQGNPDAPDPRTKVEDYEVWQVGVGGAYDYLITDRLGVAFKLDGGLAILNPSPFEASNVISGDIEGTQQFPDAGSASFGGIFSVGAGVTYATLLTGFSVGVDVRFTGIIASEFIPAVTITAPIKYNF